MKTMVMMLTLKLNDKIMTYKMTLALYVRQGSGCEINIQEL